jgi:hypothetical protein
MIIDALPGNLGRSREDASVMRLKSVVFIIGLCAANAGCSSFCQNSLRNLIEFQVETEDNFRVFLRNHQLAEAAWKQVLKSYPEGQYSVDYARGYKAGFADYLEHGGNGEPPPVPPFRYRLSAYQTPEGYRAILEWNAGFRHGGVEARRSGFRDTIVLPLASPPINAVSRDTNRATQRSGQQTPGEDGSGKGSGENPDVLPNPRPLEPTAAHHLSSLRLMF